MTYKLDSNTYRCNIGYGGVNNFYKNSPALMENDNLITNHIPSNIRTNCKMDKLRINNDIQLKDWYQKNGYNERTNEFNEKMKQHHIKNNAYIHNQKSTKSSTMELENALKNYNAYMTGKPYIESNKKYANYNI